MSTPAMHYLCWFSTGRAPTEQGFVPADGGCELEADRQAWEYSEALRTATGLNLLAFVPALNRLAEVDLDELPIPQRCLEVVSDDLLESLRGHEAIRILDLGHQPLEIAGAQVAGWLEGYRRRWREGFYVVRVPQ